MDPATMRAILAVLRLARGLAIDWTEVRRLTEREEEPTDEEIEAASQAAHRDVGRV